MKNFSKIQPVKNIIQGVKKISDWIHEKDKSPYRNRDKTGTQNLTVHHRNFFTRDRSGSLNYHPSYFQIGSFSLEKKNWPMKKYPEHENDQFLTREKISNPWKFLIFCPWKINFNPWKNLKKYPWKLWTTREILRKSTREKIFLPVKKTWKRAKRPFHGFFWFSREKKTL